MKQPTTGMVVGKFAPLHNGHINMINWAATQVDELFVVMSFDTKWLALQPPKMRRILSRNNRLRWLKTTFRDIPHIKVVCIDESNCPEYPNGWPEWSNIVKRNTDFKDMDKIFGSESNEALEYSVWWPGSKYICFDKNRDQIKISATTIRGDVFKHWEMLPSVVRADFALKVCVVGTESCGKTTLVKYLAKRFNTAWVEEFGRTFVEQDLCGDESLLEAHHYSYIAMRQKIMEHDELRACNRVLFVDTNAAVTSAFYKMYEGGQLGDEIVNAIAFQENYDVTIDLQSDVPWVDDGMRTNGSEDQRKRAREILDAELSYFPRTQPTSYYPVGGSYKDRLEESIRIVEQYLSQK